MVNYKCTRCGYIVKHKHNFFKHLKRKNPCKPLHQDISIDEVRKQFNVTSVVIQPNAISKPQPPIDNTSSLYSCEDLYRNYGVHPRLNYLYVIKFYDYRQQRSKIFDIHIYMT